ncbi:AzlD domain-containing protein [Streptococcus sp. zg-JUN1979]|uniref:AzlD domain-containing protein n=1 Tax=Streptococcus sp. zg-JUN1979 TaxID=3391450 RepID=UPI0039A49327
MTLNSTVLIVILLCGLVTFVPRIAPFIVVQYKTLPDLVIHFLRYLPLSIIFALMLSSVLDEEKGRLASIKWLELLALCPTLLVAIRYKNILLAVLVGVITMAILRLVFS